MQMSDKNKKIKCSVCFQEGIEKPVEKNPDGSSLIKIIHDDGKVCEYSEFSSISDYIDGTKRKRDPRFLLCPICGKEGRAGWYKAKAKDNKFVYYIAHQNSKLKGSWGKSKVKKVDRCYVRDPKKRDTLLKELGRTKE